jgi:hypothetical protein
VQIGVEEEKTDQVRETVWDEEMVQEKDHNGNSHLEECEVEVNSLESSKKDELKSQLQHYTKRPSKNSPRGNFCSKEKGRVILSYLIHAAKSRRPIAHE